MKILNLGSLNIDKVYDVEHFVTAGETILTDRLETFCGGKGLNQSIALARAGAEVCHAGAVGPDGEGLCELLRQAGADVSLLQHTAVVSGHAVIQLSPSGQNCIIVYGGANNQITEGYIDSVLGHFTAGDILLLQNEISGVPYAIQAAKKKGMLVAFNASPISKEMEGYPLSLVDYYLINEVEGKALSGATSSDSLEILEALGTRFPASAIVLTVGKEGAYYQKNGQREWHGIYDVPVVDTTAAGDTFCGYFIASIAKGHPVAKALHLASVASSLAVSKKGAGNSIPTLAEVIRFEEEWAPHYGS